MIKTPKIVLLAIGVCLCLAGVAQTFVRFYPGEIASVPNVYINSVPTCMEKSGSGGFFIGGYTSDPDTISLQKMQLRKIDGYGNELWNIKDGVTNFDEISDIVIYNDNAIFCTARFGSQVGLVRRNGNGSMEWAKNLLPIQDTCSGANAIVKTHDGNLILCGALYKCGSSEGDIFIIKVDTAGSVIWRKTYVMPWDNSAGQVIELADSTLVMVGGTNEIDSSNSYTKSFLCKMNSGGDIEWFKTYGTSQAALSLALLPDSTFAIGNTVDNISMQTSPDGLFFIADDTGAIAYEFTDTLIYENFFVKLKRVGSTVYLLAYASPGKNSDTSIDIRLLKYDIALQTMNFSKTFGLVGWQQPKDIEIFDDGRVAITFYESDSLCLGCTGLVVLDSLGCVFEWCYTGIEDESTSALRIYPNPFSDFLEVRFTGTADVALYNVFGRQMYTDKNVDGYKKIATTELPNGIYYLEVSTHHASHVTKLVKAN